MSLASTYLATHGSLVVFAAARLCTSLPASRGVQVREELMFQIRTVRDALGGEE
jgi:hypothetical protein